MSSAGRNVLCKRHNGALSKLDDIGRRFVRTHLGQIKHRMENSPSDAHALFNGYDIKDGC